MGSQNRPRRMRLQRNSQARRAPLILSKRAERDAGDTPPIIEFCATLRGPDELAALWGDRPEARTMADIDRALYGANVIAQILRADEATRTEAGDWGAEYKGLGGYIRGGLHAAQVALFDSAALALEGLRNKEATHG